MVYTSAILLSLIGYFVIGHLAGRRVKHLDDYLVAGRNAPTFLILGTLVASYLSTSAFLGETGFAYQGYPFVMLIFAAISTSGCLLGALAFGRYLRRSGALTVPEFFGKRFSSKRVQRIAGLTTVLGLGAYLLGVMQGAGIMFQELTGLPYWVGLVLVWLTYTGFILYSGSPGVMLTDTIMFVIFSVAALGGSLYIIQDLGGWHGVVEGLLTQSDKPGIALWHGVLQGDDATFATPGEALTWGLTLGLVWAAVLAASPWQSSRYLMARNEHVVMRSAMLTAVSLAVFYALMMMTGAAINLYDPTLNGERAMVWAALNVLPTWLGVVILTGVFAAGLSSCSTFLSIIGFSISNDIMPANSSEAAAMRTSRFAVLGAGLIALILALFQPPAVMAVVWFAATLFASSWGPVALMSIWSRRITAAGAGWGLTVGFIGNLILSLMVQAEWIALPTYLHPVLLSTLMALVAIAVASSMTRVSQAESDYRAFLHRDDEHEPAGWAAGSRGVAVFTMLAGVGVGAFLWRQYADTLAELAGRFGIAESAVTGAYALALGCGGMLVIAGAVGYRVVRSRHAAARQASTANA
ncbi:MULTISPECIES: sodium:solute symporter family protein [Halomonas]|uniref:Sodium:proline symporter n=1 Tax=Halomonas halophila TaxID=29573 RepID=A0ABQ0U753_9GAMM|nr:MULTISPECIES: sodium:solute symporter family protein [Halomonas]MDR5890612.1 sodium:solute symporter family protein [Halomonas salina]WJY06025.1 sodium:solute symporter family protein [Halomonas halophila]GEK74349.1 sodium:proline symporter [Halomonas halophila]